MEIQGFKGLRTLKKKKQNETGISLPHPLSLSPTLPKASSQKKTGGGAKRRKEKGTSSSCLSIPNKVAWISNFFCPIDVCFGSLSLLLVYSLSPLFFSSFQLLSFFWRWNVLVCLLVMSSLGVLVCRICPGSYFCLFLFFFSFVSLPIPSFLLL